MRSVNKGLINVSEALGALAELLPERTSLSQILFFLHAARADMLGKPKRFSDIKEDLGDRINRSLHTTYKLFLSDGNLREGARQPGLGWLYTEANPQDLREKFIRLTPAGKKLLKDLNKQLTKCAGVA